MNEYERLFYEDIRIKSMANKGLKGGALRYETELGNVEKKSIGMYYHDFKRKTRTEQKQLLEEWYKDRTPMEIALALRTKANVISQLLKYYQIIPKSNFKPRTEESVTADPVFVINPIVDGENDMTYEAFKELPDAERVHKYDEMMKTTSNVEAAAKWGITPQSLYGLVYKSKNRLKKGKIRSVYVDPKTLTRKPVIQNDVVKTEVTDVESARKRVTATEIISFMHDIDAEFTLFKAKIEGLEKENERLKKVEQSFNGIMVALGNATNTINGG